MKVIVILALLLISGTVSFAQMQMPPEIAALANEKDSAVLKEKLTQLRNSDKEADLMLLARYYAYKRNSDKYKEISKLAAEKFPKGQAAYNAALQEMQDEKDPAEAEQLYKKLIVDFPRKDQSLPQFVVASAYAAVNNKKKVIEYADKFKTDTMSIEQFNVILAEEMLKHDDVKTAEYLIIPALEASKKGDSRERYNITLLTYAKVLLKKGSSAEGYLAAKEAYDNSNKKNTFINNVYISALLATNRMDEALPLMESSLSAGMASDETRKRIKEVYVKVNGSEAGFDAFMDKINEELLKHTKERVARMLINQPSVDFTLLDVNGKKVSLSELRGKIVVLDFWATWCAPCKKSFPAMQTAINRYKNDPNVKFLFIHTWENGPIDPAVAAKKYVTDNRYTFDVLIDRKDPATGINKVVTDYKVTGIPAKFVLDAKGNIRFKVVGSGAGDDASVEEIAAMIELARNS